VRLSLVLAGRDRSHTSHSQSAMSALGAATKRAVAPSRAAAVRRRSAALVRPAAVAPRRTLAAAAAANADDAKQPLPTLSAAAALAAALLSATAGPALADDAPEAAAAVAAAAATATADGGINPTLLFAAWPVLVYALFAGVIRPRVNPKANFGDFLYLLVFSVIILNLILGVFFKFRIY